MALSFSVNQYDFEGDLFDDCVLLHIDDNHIMRFKDVDALVSFANEIQSMVPQIVECIADRDL